MPGMCGVGSGSGSGGDGDGGDKSFKIVAKHLRKTVTAKDACSLFVQLKIAMIKIALEITHAPCTNTVSCQC